MDADTRADVMDADTRADAEVIVVGGGPAGAATAIHLARRGRRVTLLEGRDFARPRMADIRGGEVLSPAGQRELAALDLPLDAGQEGFRLQPFDLLRQSWPNGRVTLDQLPSGLQFWQLDRGRLDRALCALARAEGVDVREASRVRDVVRDVDGAVCGVVTKSSAAAGRVWRAPLVVDASGRRSALLARLALKRPEPEFQRVALVLFFSAAPDAAPGVWEQYFLGAHNTTLRGSLMRPGLYRYSFETDLAFRDAFAARHGKSTPHAMVLAMLTELAPALHERFEAACPLPYSAAYAPVGYRVSRITHDGLVLVGDAAGYLDPSTGQGVEFALRTARLAAASLDAALDARDYRRERFVPYLDGRRHEIDAATRKLRLMLRLSRRRPVLGLVSRVGPVRAAVVRAMVRPPR